MKSPPSSFVAGDGAPYAALWSHADEVSISADLGGVSTSRALLQPLANGHRYSSHR